jgi:hypothetical protein
MQSSGRIHSRARVPAIPSFTAQLVHILLPYGIPSYGISMSGIVFTSATPRFFDRGDVDFLHRHHCLEGTFRFAATSCERVG